VSSRSVPQGDVLDGLAEMRQVFLYPEDKATWEALAARLWEADNEMASEMLHAFIEEQRARRRPTPWRTLNGYVTVAIRLFGFVPAGWPGNEEGEEPQAEDGA
jgi:hypothetical protein